MTKLFHLIQALKCHTLQQSKVELLNTIEAEDNTIPTIDQVRQMRKKADEGELTTAIMEQIMRTEKPEKSKYLLTGIELKNIFRKTIQKSRLKMLSLKL